MISGLIWFPFNWNIPCHKQVRRCLLIGSNHTSILVILSFWYWPVSFGDILVAKWALLAILQPPTANTSIHLWCHPVTMPLLTSAWAKFLDNNVMPGNVFLLDRNCYSSHTNIWFFITYFPYLCTIWYMHTFIQYIPTILCLGIHENVMNSHFTVDFTLFVIFERGEMSS